MRIEDKLGETMRAAVADEPLPRDVYEAFERRARRSQRARLVAGGLAVAAAVVAAAVVVPKVLPKDERIGTASPGPSAPLSPSPSSDPTADWKTYTHTGQAWLLRHPADWRSGMFEGEWEFHPADLPGTPVGEPTYAVGVMLRDESWDTGEKCPQDALCETDQDRSLFGGRHYWLLQRTTERGGVYKVYRVDWSGSNVQCAPGTPCTNATLQVSITASTKDLLGKYDPIGRLILTTIEHL